MKQIETGIDKLMQLIKKNKSISITKASDELGIAKSLIQEWAEFLEIEGHVSIEYKMFVPYITQKLMSKKELTRQKKEHNNVNTFRKF